jgi:hypothetical protein
VTVAPPLIEPDIAPTAYIDSPSGNITIDVGDSVSFSGHGTDPDGDPIDFYRWLSNCGPGGVNLKSGSSFTQSFTTPGTYTFCLTVRANSKWSSNCPCRTITVDNPVCIDTSWSPATSTVCSGTPFPQTSNCGTTRTDWGSFNCSLPGYSTFNHSCSANTLTTTERFYTYPCVSGACGSPTLASQNSVNESCDTARQTCADGLLKSRCIDASTLESYKEYNEGTCSVSTGACLESTKECDSVEEICESGYTCKATGTDTADCVPKSSSWTEV